MASLERHVYDPQNGLPANVGYYQCKPPTYLDVPSNIGWTAVDIADPDNPVGARGVGEPAMGSATAAVMCALSDALGGHLFNRTPVTPGCDRQPRRRSGPVVWPAVDQHLLTPSYTRRS